MLDVWRLKLLVQFDTLKTMHRVAEVMAVTTATVSTQLKLLETQTNSTLFEKVGRNVALTATGKQLVKQVRPILDELEEVERTLNAPRNDDRGIVRIGAFSSSLQTLVVPAVTQVKDQHAGISFVLSEMEPPESLAALSSHQIDLAIIGYIGELMTIPDELTAIELGTDQLQVLLHDRNPLAAQTGVSIADLREQDWAMEPQGAYLTDRLWRLCQDAGYQPRQVATFQDYAAIRAAVQHHFAIGVLPGIAIPTHLSHVRAVPLVPHQRRHFYLVSRRAQARLQPLVLTKQAIQGVGEQVLQ